MVYWKSLQKAALGAGETAQWVEVIAGKPKKLSLCPDPSVVGEENSFHVSSSEFHTCVVAYTPTCTCVPVTYTNHTHTTRGVRVMKTVLSFHT